MHLAVFSIVGPFRTTSVIVNRESVAGYQRIDHFGRFFDQITAAVAKPLKVSI